MCSICEKLFPSSYQCTRHEKTCENKTHFKYPGGFHQMSETVFEELEEFGCFVPISDRMYSWFIVYDFEALINPLDNEQNTTKLQWQAQHIPISVSVCSNHQNYSTPQCFVSSDPDNLLTKMLEYMENISDTCNKEALRKWNFVTDYLNNQIQHWSKAEPSKTDTAMVNALIRMMDKFRFY